MLEEIFVNLHLICQKKKKILGENSVVSKNLFYKIFLKSLITKIKVIKKLKFSKHFNSFFSFKMTDTFYLHMVITDAWSDVVLNDLLMISFSIMFDRTLF